MEYDIEKILTMYEDDYNPRSMVPGPRNMASGGRIPFAKAKSVQKAGNQKGKFRAKSMDNISDAILKAYADDNIQILFEKGKSNPQGLLTHTDSKAGIFQKIKTDQDRLNTVVKNTGLDQETILNILDDRDAFLELEKTNVGQQTRFKDQIKFFNKAEKWLTTNAKRYSDPVKFEKAFARTFGKNNPITKTIKANITETRGKGRLTGFSDDFVKTIMSTSQGIDPNKTFSAFNSKQLKDMFKTVIYNNNPNVRNKITKIFENIIPEPGSTRTPDIRNLFANNPTLQKFGLDKSIKGPIARLIANEINETLFTNVKNFQKPFLGTEALLRYLKDRVDPKYKDMFREASNAVKQAQKNQWPEAKKSLNISQSIMFDHKIPKSIIDLGYADPIEYIKLNPTSEKFNATVKRSQFDRPMLDLISKFENSNSLDAKASVVEEMNTLKNNFSKKYKGYLDEVTIVPDKTGKPIFKSSASPVTKKTDFVSSLKKSMIQTGEVKKGSALFKKILKDLEIRGCGKAAGGRILFSNGGEAITACAKKGVAGFVDDLKKGNYSKATMNILKGGGNVLKNIVNPMELLKLRNYFGPAALGFMAAFEGGVITDDVIRQGTPLNESLANNWLTKAFLPYTKEYAKAKNLLATGKVPSHMKKYVKDVITFNEVLKDTQGIENRVSSRLIDDTGYGMLDGTSMYTKEQQDKEEKAVEEKLKGITDYNWLRGSAKDLEYKSLQDEMAATRMAKPKIMGKGSYLDDVGMEQFSEGFQYSDGFSPVFGFDKLKDRNQTVVFDDYISPVDTPKDFRPYTYKDAEYKDVEKLPAAERQKYENFLTKTGILKPRKSLSELLWDRKTVGVDKFDNPINVDTTVYDELLKDYNKGQKQKEASQYPGYYGANEKFSEGGITALRSKYEYKK